METIDKKISKKSEKLVVQERDIEIFNFLNRVGYANLEQITKFITNLSDEKSQNAIMRRLYLLRRFDYLKVIHTHLGNYYALTTKSKLSNQLISGVKLDQLPHHNFLLDLFYTVKDMNVLTEREVLARYKVIGKKGKIPDMIVNDWIVEYERTNKSVVDSKSVVEHWTGEQGKNLCVICESIEIKNRYEALLNPRVKLLMRQNYKDILNILVKTPVEFNASSSVFSNQNTAVHDNYAENIKNKYL